MSTTSPSGQPNHPNNRNSLFNGTGFLRPAKKPLTSQSSAPSTAPVPAIHDGNIPYVAQPSPNPVVGNPGDSTGVFKPTPMPQPVGNPGDGASVLKTSNSINNTSRVSTDITPTHQNSIVTQQTNSPQSPVTASAKNDGAAGTQNSFIPVSTTNSPLQADTNNNGTISPTEALTARSQALNAAYGLGDSGGGTPSPVDNTPDPAIAAAMNSKPPLDNTLDPAIASAMNNQDSSTFTSVAPLPVDNAIDPAIANAMNNHGSGAVSSVVPAPIDNSLDPAIANAMNNPDSATPSAFSPTPAPVDNALDPAIANAINNPISSTPISVVSAPVDNAIDPAIANAMNNPGSSAFSSAAPVDNTMDPAIANAVNNPGSGAVGSVVSAPVDNPVDPAIAAAMASQSPTDSTLDPAIADAMNNPDSATPGAFSPTPAPVDNTPDPAIAAAMNSQPPADNTLDPAIANAMNQASVNSTPEVTSGPTWPPTTNVTPDTQVNTSVFPADPGNITGHGAVGY